MNQVKQLREYTRELECHLANMNQSDCCQCGVNTSQCFLLVEIGRKPGICVKELAEVLRLDKSGISRSVEELVQKGYVNREPSREDRRSVVLSLTDSGRERFDRIENDMDMKFRKVLSGIETEKREQVLEALRLYNEACTCSPLSCHPDLPTNPQTCQAHSHLRAGALACDSFPLPSPGLAPFFG